jgi:hypothetical protein
MTKIPVDEGNLQDVIDGTRLLMPVVVAASKLRFANETFDAEKRREAYDELCSALDAIDEHAKAGR